MANFAVSPLSGYGASVIPLESYSTVSDKYLDESYCTTWPTPPTLTAGSVNQDLCFWWDGVTYEYPFNPVTLSNPACTDTGVIVEYSVISIGGNL